MAEKTYDLRVIKAIIGLGNPGGKYKKTRHNIGFRVVEAFVDRYVTAWKNVDLMEYAIVSWTDAHDQLPRSIYVIKPQTFMNNSGRVISFLMKKGISADQILVVHDELEKSFGDISLKFGGSAKGHNGLRSIQSVIGSDFWRLRFGIGRPEDKSEVGDYVLSVFSTEEEIQIPMILSQALVKLESIPKV